MQKYLPAVGVVVVIALIGYVASFPWVRPSDMTFGTGTKISHGSQDWPDVCTAPENLEAIGTKTYTDTMKRFTVDYPAGWAACEYTNGIGGVFFMSDPSGMGDGGIFVAEAEEANTQAWLDVQPKGSVDSEGIRFREWLDAGSERWAIIERYSIMELDVDEQPIIEPRLEAVMVKNGAVFHGFFMKDLSGGAISALNLSTYPTEVNILQSFRLI